MKFSLKFALALCLIASLASLAGVFAQTSNINSVTSPTTNNLNSVFLVNNITATNNDLTELDAWAVGDSGTILRWNGNTWSTVTSPTSMNLYSVFFVNSSWGWAVGGTSTNGVILQYNGSWSTYTNVTFSGYPNATDTINATLYSVTMGDNGTAGWAVGAGGAALMYSAGAWYGMNTSTSNILRSVGMIHNANDAWAVGDKGTIIQWTGIAWQNLTSPTTMNLNTIEMVNASVAWAGGGTTDNGIIAMMNGTNWSIYNRINMGGALNTTVGYNTDTLNATVNSISMDTASSAWAVGGKGMVLYFNGTEWQGALNVAGTGTLKSVSMVHGTSNGSLQAWAVGDTGGIFAFNGTKWVPELPIMAIPLLMSIGLAVALLGKAKMARKRVF